ncbi:hypothetical protein R3P38DRAFT_3219564 [Favolaschia claudopus]|uniref:Uncharacterized protein n=1 Tax=Favolaschia claudopus TaxID=2862362 RepID=A0AAW0A2X7_9AGAR
MPSPTADTTDPASVERDLASIVYIRDVLLPQLPLRVYIPLRHVSTPDARPLALNAIDPQSRRRPLRQSSRQENRVA